MLASVPIGFFFFSFFCTTQIHWMWLQYLKLLQVSSAIKKFVHSFVLSSVGNEQRKCNWKLQFKMNSFFLSLFHFSIENIVAANFVIPKVVVEWSSEFIISTYKGLPIIITNPVLFQKRSRNPIFTSIIIALQL